MSQTVEKGAPSNNQIPGLSYLSLSWVESGTWANGLLALPPSRSSISYDGRLSHNLRRNGRLRDRLRRRRRREMSKVRQTLFLWRGAKTIKNLELSAKAVKMSHSSQISWLKSSLDWVDSSSDSFVTMQMAKNWSWVRLLTQLTRVSWLRPTALTATKECFSGHANASAGYLVAHHFLCNNLMLNEVQRDKATVKLVIL